MPQKKNMFLRVLVPILLVGVIAVVGWSVLTNSNKLSKPKPAAASAQPSASPAQPEASTQPKTEPPAPAAQPSAPPSTTPAAQPVSTPPSTPTNSVAPATPPTLSAKILPEGADTREPFTPIGSLKSAKEGNPYEMEITFSPFGAGITAIRLANEFDSIRKDASHEVIQQAEQYEVPLVGPDGLPAGSRMRTIVPFALLGVTIDGTFVNLAVNPAGPIWRQIASGSFEATIVDEKGSPVARVTRTYTLAPNVYEAHLEQKLQNLTNPPRDLHASWLQFGPVDLPIGVIRYGGDVRRIRFGYLTSPAIDPDQQVVRADVGHMLPHAAALGDATAGPSGEFTFAEKTLWPDANVTKDGLSLAWAGLTNRFFAVAAHALPSEQPPRTDTPTKNAPDKRFHLGQSVDRVVLTKGGADKAETVKNAVMAMRFTSATTLLPAGGTLDADMGIYAGPIDRTYAEADAPLKSMGLGELVIFTFGGPCAFCTFQPIAFLLHYYLHFLHDHIVFDWALGIIVLVLTVRTILHPITRWSQTSLQRFSKQMASLAPKQAKLKEKFGNDPKKLREEVAKLMQEEKINYAGALGCLPMFLQTPVWIALYAMIFFTFELRHQGGFFGLFQALGHPTFLADLSEPDKFIPLGTSIHVPLISGLMGPIDSFNLVPLILGVVFWIQQKYLTPPSAATMTPEQESQQKIMKVMMVVMFPVFMYNAPAALSLYFMTNSTLGILESRWIRKGIEAADANRKADLAAGVGTSMFDRKDTKYVKNVRPGTLVAKPPGFMARLRAAIEAKQREMDKARKQKGNTRAGPKRTGKPPR